MSFLLSDESNEIVSNLIMNYLMYARRGLVVSMVAYKARGFGFNPTCFQYQHRLVVNHRCKGDVLFASFR